MKINFTFRKTFTAALVIYFSFLTGVFAQSADTLHLKFFISGYYQYDGTMTTVLYNQMVDTDFYSGNVDTVTIELHKPLNVSTVAASYKGILQYDGTLDCIFPDSLTNHAYYVVIKHRNALETWSASPVAMGTSVSYDFTTNANKAYGSNMVDKFSNGIWSIYSGDITDSTEVIGVKDGIIDMYDYVPFDIDAFNGVYYEYAATDFNGDGFVDASDFPELDMGIFYGVTVARPGNLSCTMTADAVIDTVASRGRQYATINVNANNASGYVFGTIHTGVAEGTYTYIITDSYGCTASSTITFTHIPTPDTLKLKFFIEGYYAGGGMMKPVLYNEMVDTDFYSGKVDTVSIELHSPANVDSIAQSFKGILQYDGTINCVFPTSVTDHAYYIVIKHRNALETWSANPVTLRDTAVHYDFTNDSSKAYGHNMAGLGSGKWGLYSGNITDSTEVRGAKDDIIDVYDFTLLESDNYAGVYGYYETDFNGDGWPDASDFGGFFSTNIYNGIAVIRPGSASCAMTVTASTDSSIKCYGGTTSITLSASGAIGAVFGSTHYTGVAAGTHTYSLTNSLGCASSATITISEPAVLAAHAGSDNILCSGDSLTLGSSPTASGGANSYTYRWFPTEGLSDSTAANPKVSRGMNANSSPDQYIVTVTDSNRCISSDTVLFMIYQKPSATISSSANVSCYGGNNGSATLHVNSGYSPYTYSWSPSGGTDTIATGLTPGIYTATVTDIHGCSLGRKDTITQSSTLIDSIKGDLAIEYGDTSILTLYTRANPAQLLWLATGDTTSSISITPPATGIYSVIVADTNGCSATSSITVTVSYSSPILAIAPDLGEAAYYALLSNDSIYATDSVYANGSVGAISNITHYITSSDSIYPLSGGTVSLALNDLQTAIALCDAQTGIPIDGNLKGLTLAAGVYEINGNAYLDSTFSLSGDSSGIYIFNINGNFTMDTGSTINIGMARPDNIYWNVSGKMISKFKVALEGTYLVSDSAMIGDSASGKFGILSNSFVQIKSIDHHTSDYSVFSHSSLDAFLTNVGTIFNPKPCSWVRGIMPKATGLGRVLQDINGSVYQTGSYSETQAVQNIYLNKYQPDGKIIEWSVKGTSTGANSYSSAIGIQRYVDNDHDLIVISGTFRGNATFGKDDSGNDVTVTSTHSGNDQNGFIARYNASTGTVFGSILFDGESTSGDARLSFIDLYIDGATGNAYVACQYGSVADNHVSFSGHAFPNPILDNANRTNSAVICYGSVTQTAMSYSWGNWLTYQNKYEFVGVSSIRGDGTYLLIVGNFSGSIDIGDSNGNIFDTMVLGNPGPSDATSNQDAFVVQYEINNQHDPIDFLTTYPDSPHNSQSGGYFPDIVADPALDQDFYVLGAFGFGIARDRYLHFKSHTSTNNNTTNLFEASSFSHGSSYVLSLAASSSGLGINWTSEAIRSTSGVISSPWGIGANSNNIFLTGVVDGSVEYYTPQVHEIYSNGNSMFIEKLNKTEGKPIDAVLDGGENDNFGVFISATDCRYAVNGQYGPAPCPFYLDNTEGKIAMYPGDAYGTFLLSTVLNPLHVTISQTETSNDGCIWGGPVTLTANASGGIGSYSYLWSPGGETTSEITITDWGVYSISVDDPSGCNCPATSSVTFLPPAPCCRTAPTPQSNYHYIVSAYTLNSNSTGAIFDVNDNITLDGHVTLAGCTLNIAAGMKITIPAGSSLDLENCHLHACDNMWDGIYIQGTSSGTGLTMNRTEIHDAENAVVSQDGGPFTIIESRFIDNYKGIVVNEYDGDHDGSVVGTTFTSTGTLHAPHNTNSYSYPTIGRSGIEINNVSHITIGSLLSNSERNTFATLWAGITISQSNVEIYQSNFININNGCFNPSSNHLCAGRGTLCLSGSCPPYGTAIYDIGDPNYLVSGKASTLTVGYNLTLSDPLSCIFDICTYGIWASYNIAGFIRGNTFRYCNDGAYFSSGNAVYLLVFGNHFSNFLTGISCIDYGTSSSYVEIINNDFNKRVNYPTIRYGNKAIYVSHRIPQYMKARISNNYINNVSYGVHLLNLRSGFDASDVSYVRAIDNTIEFRLANANIIANGGTQYGILLENCTANEISNNIIKRYNDAANINVLDKLRGIGIKNSTNCKVMENRIGGYMTGLGMGTGIFVQNNCNGTNLICNKMYDNYQSINLNKASLLTQGDASTSKSWDNYFGNNISSNKIAGSLLNLNTPINWYFYHSLGTSYSPIPSAIFIRPIQSNNSSNCTQALRMSNSQERDSAFTYLVGDSIQYNSLADENKYYDFEYFYQTMKGDTSLMYLGTPHDTSYQQLCDSLRNSNIGIFSHIQQEFDSGSWELGLQDIYTSIGDNTIENNKLNATIIYFSTLASGGNLDEEQTATLTDIANQTAVEGGEGVYYARAMLGLDIEDETSEEARIANLKNVDSLHNNNEEIGKFYPNPARSILNFDYSIDENEKGIILFRDLLGRTVSVNKFYGGYNHMEINISQLLAGIYFIDVQVDGSVIQRTKEVILK